jgi:hypothetical protein
MLLKNHIMILIFLGVQLAAIAQADTISQSYYIPPPLFESNELIELIVAFDMPAVLRDIGDDRKYHDAFLSYFDLNGDTVQLQIRIRTRGNFRRDPDNCNFPPLRFDFTDAAIENTIFERQARLKLVTHCSARKKYYEEYLLKEYLTYRLYNILTEESFRVRLVRITYVDISGRREPLEKYGFFLETSGKMAARNGCEEFDIENVKQKDIQDDVMVKISMFQFMIGNTDWSVQALHNIELIRPAPHLPPIAVPYDFDWCGLVNTNYAFPAPNLEIQSVRERLYRGLCRTSQEYQDAIQFFQEKEKEIYSSCNNLTYLEEKERKQIVRYIEQFYFILDNPRLTDSEIYAKCRTE